VIIVSVRETMKRSNIPLKSQSMLCCVCIRSVEKYVNVKKSLCDPIMSLEIRRQKNYAFEIHTFCCEQNACDSSMKFQPGASQSWHNFFTHGLLRDADS
jgi:hypothetical protein